VPWRIAKLIPVFARALSLSRAAAGRVFSASGGKLSISNLRCRIVTGSKRAGLPRKA